MRITFNLCKTVMVFLVLFSILPSCVPSIRIVYGDTTTHELFMINSQGDSASIYTAHPGERIKWKILNHSNVDLIDSISKKESSDDLFSKEPHKKFLSKKWEGKIETASELRNKKKFGEYYKEEYNIFWKHKNGSLHKYDPKIQVN